MGAPVKILLGLTLLTVSPEPSLAQPERIRPGVSYYSDACVQVGEVFNIENEKNFEEVYQLYRYCEIVYDAEGRVDHFREYQQGELLREELYTYAEDGRLVSKETRRPGAPPEIHSWGKEKTQP